LSAHPAQYETTGIPATILPGQTVQFTIITKDARGTPLTVGGGVKVQLDSGKGDIQSMTVKDCNNGCYTTLNW